MQTQEFQKFKIILATLGVTFSREIDDPVSDVYWTALRFLTIDQVERGVALCIRNCKHFPRPAEIIELCKQAENSAHRPMPSLPPIPANRWQRLGDGMFLKYLMRRRLTEGVKGDINLCERRAELLNLAAYMRDLERDPQTAESATEAHMLEVFNKTMARIPDDLATVSDQFASKAMHGFYSTAAA